MLLGAAHVLTQNRDKLTRDVLFCFQPAEEGQGGAEAMIADGVLEQVPLDAVYGLHLWSLYETGSVHVRPGPAMAAQDEFRATIRGRGGHGAAPHQAVDPLVAASQAVTALQSIVSRNVDPLEAAVVTVGSLHAGSAPNVIPDEAKLEGTLRSFSQDVRGLLRNRVPHVLTAVAAAADCELDFELSPGYPAVVNDPAHAARAAQVAASVVGPDNVVEPPPIAAAEDFAYYLERLPGAFIFVGAGNRERGITAPHHSPQFDIDEAALPVGAELLVRLALG
jgi:amidohydrolase